MPSYDLFLLFIPPALSRSWIEFLHLLLFFNIEVGDPTTERVAAAAAASTAKDAPTESEAG
jgi:hypothetical protein